MADTLESLEIKVQHNASGADAEINGVATAIGRLKTALTGVPAALKELASAVKAVNEAFKGGTAKYDKFAESMLNVATSAELLGENSSHVMTLANAMNTLTSVKVTAGSFNALAKGVEGVGTAAQTITPEAISNLDKMVTSLAKLQGVDLQGLGSAMSAVRRGGSVTPKEPPVPVPDGSRELISNASAIDVLEAKLVSLREAMEQAFNAGDTDKAYSLRNQILQTEAALERAKKAANDAASGVKNLSKQASKSKGPLGTLVASLKRIAFYRILRSILKSISQAFQEGLEKAYLFSQGMSGEGNRFAQSLDRMKSAGNQMKGQLGSAFISLLAAVEPVLITLINLVTKAADAISQLLAAFTGKTYLKANATAAQFADTMAGGAAAAKEWKNQLLGFDEINRLNAPSDGGGGGGTNPLAGYEMVDTPINEKLLTFINNIKEKLQPAIDRLKEAFDRLKEAWQRFSDSITNDGALTNLISDFFVLCGNVILDGLTILADTLTLILDILTALNTGDWSQVWRSFAQLLYDIVVLVADIIVGVGNLIEDAFIVLLDIIDDIIGTHFADDLREDQRAFNDMYTAAKESDEGLFGLKRTLGLTADTTKKASEETDKFTEALAGVSSQSGDTKQKVNGIRSSVDWVLDGFRGFGTEVAQIFTSLFYPIQSFCNWIDSALQRIGIFNGLTSRVNQMQNDGSIYLQGFASGGHPTEGQLFFANEAGPEMVGTIGGRSTVATNDDIVEGIRQGVYDAVLAANGSNSGDVSVKVYLDSREIKAGQQRLNRAWGV